MTPKLSLPALLLAAAALTGSGLPLAPVQAAQVSEPGMALGRAGLGALQGNPVRLQAPDVEFLLLEDEARTEGPLRYGIPIEFSAGIETHGAWSTAPDGAAAWRLEVTAPGALSLGLEFASFDLPSGAQLFAYDPAEQRVLGAFTERNERSSGEFTLSPIQGDRVILELRLPVGSAGTPRLVLDRVIYDYRGVFGLLAETATPETDEADLNEEGACLIDANCPEGDPFATLKRATVRTTSNGFLCSGVLLNNTAEDGTPYLYTANHCDTGSDVVLNFNYQLPECGLGIPPLDQTVTGGTLLVTDGNSDGRLLLVDSPIPLAFAPYYAGWSRRQAGVNFGVAMHHAFGGPKKVAIDSNGGPKATVQFPAFGLVKIWEMNFDVGGTQPGSSGGPLQDQNDLIRGVLTGGDGCTLKFFGRFYNFWDQGLIGAFLDPLGTEPLEFGGFDPLGGTPEPVVNTVFPPAIPVVLPNGPPEISLTGANFSNVVEVRINGVALPTAPPAWTIQTDSLLTFTPTQPELLGAQTVTLVTGLGSVDTSFDVVPTPLGASLDLVDSDPKFLLSAFGLRAYLGAPIGWVAFLTASPSPVPTVIPGLVTLDLGNGILELVNLGARVIDPATGSAFWEFPLPATLPTGLKLYVQAAIIDPATLATPLATSNLEVGTFLF